MAMLSLDFTNVQPAKDFEYPPGDYIMQVEKAEEVPTKEGTGTRLALVDVIIDGPPAAQNLKGKHFPHGYGLTEKAKPYVMRLFNACGITQAFIAQNGNRIDPAWLIGRQFKCRVSKNAKSNFAEVSREEDVSKWVPQGVAGTQSLGQPPAPQFQGAPQVGMMQPVGMQPQQQQQPVVNYQQPITGNMQQQQVAPQMGFSPPPPSNVQFPK